MQNVAEQVLYLFGMELDFVVARQAGIDKTIRRIEEEANGEAHGRENGCGMSE